jgi:Flp pilus assembly protein TadD
MALATVALAAVGSVSCASKTSARLRPAPFFSPTSTREAVNAVDAGDGDLEIAGLRKAVMSRPDDVDTRMRLAEAYSKRGFADVALEHYRLLAERFPDSLKATLRLARALRQADQKEEALRMVQAFIKLNPQRTAEPYEWLGILNDDLANWKESQFAYETALLYAPQSAELHNNLGYSFLMQSQNNNAAREFRTALRLNKDLAIARNNLGIALMENPKEAILHWQAVSGPAAAHNNMAALLIERGQYAEARKELEAALGFDQQNAQAVFNLALVADRDGKPAVLPQRNSDSATAKTVTAKTSMGGAFARFFRGSRSSKPASGDAPSADKPAERTVANTGSGSGN